MEQLIISDKSKNLVHVIIGIKTGWRHEKRGKTGIAHFLEHAIFLGNKTHPTPDNEVAKHGVQLNGMTLPEHTLFYFTSTKEDFTNIFRLFLDLIFHPEFNEHKLNKEKKEKIITAVIQESDFAPWELSYQWAMNLLFDWDFMVSMGTEKDIKSLTREDLFAWHRKYYHAENSFIVIYGDVQENKLMKLIDDAHIPSSGETPCPFNIQHDKREIFIKRGGMKNVEMVYGFKLPQYDIRWDVLAVVLGNYPMSKLWGEKFHNLTYMVESKLKWTTTNGGFFLYFGANSIDNSYKIDENLWLLLGDFEINERELEFAKKIRLIEILKMKEEGEHGLLKFISCNPFLIHKDFNEMIKRVNQVKKEEVLDLVARLLNKENVVKVKVGAEK